MLLIGRHGIPIGQRKSEERAPAHKHAADRVDIVTAIAARRAFNDRHCRTVDRLNDDVIRNAHAVGQRKTRRHPASGVIHAVGHQHESTIADHVHRRLNGLLGSGPAPAIPGIIRTRRVNIRRIPFIGTNIPRGTNRACLTGNIVGEWKIRISTQIQSLIQRIGIGITQSEIFAAGSLRNKHNGLIAAFGIRRCGITGNIVRGAGHKYTVILDIIITVIFADVVFH